MMLGLRPYKPCDAQTVVTWLENERIFRMWSSDRFGDYPITADDLNRKYIDLNGDCPDGDNFFPMTAFDENGVVGSMILRYTDVQRKTVRFGFVVVAPDRRGMGYGKKMVCLALKFAFEILGAERVTIGVFDCNPSAYRCYKAAGFAEADAEAAETCELLGETWSVIELEMTKAAYDAALF